MIKLKGLVVYFYDDVLNILYNGRIIEKKLNCINQGMVVNRTEFIENFGNILKKEKIRNKLFGDKIYVVKDVYFKESDLFYLESIFTDLGFLKVKFLNILDYFMEEYTYIGVFNNYIVFYLDKPVLLDLIYFKDFPKLIDYFIDYYQNCVILFGSNSNIPNISSNYVNIYYIDNYKNYIINSLLKVKKYDV